MLHSVVLKDFCLTYDCEMLLGAASGRGCPLGVSHYESLLSGVADDELWGRGQDEMSMCVVPLSKGPVA